MEILKSKNGQAIAPPTVKMDKSAFAPSDETFIRWLGNGCGFYINTPDGTVWLIGDSKLIPEQLSFLAPGRVRILAAGEKYTLKRRKKCFPTTP